VLQLVVGSIETGARAHVNRGDVSSRVRRILVRFGRGGVDAVARDRGAHPGRPPEHQRRFEVPEEEPPLMGTEMTPEPDQVPMDDVPRIGVFHGRQLGGLVNVIPVQPFAPGRERGARGTPGVVPAVLSLTARAHAPTPCSGSWVRLASALAEQRRPYSGDIEKDLHSDENSTDCRQLGSIV
jgi:hypothetical protein